MKVGADDYQKGAVLHHILPEFERQGWQNVTVCKIKFQKQLNSEEL